LTFDFNFRFVDEAGHPTAKALKEVRNYFDKQLR